MLKAGTWNSRGFTFIEISLVLLILSIFAVAALPRFAAFYSGKKLENSVSKLTVYIEHMRDLAMFKRQTLFLHCDLETGRFWVTTAVGKKNRAVMMRPFTVLDSVKVSEIDVAGKEKITEGEAVITFYPGGKASPALLHLKSEDGGEVTLDILYLARDVKRYEGYVERF